LAGKKEIPEKKTNKKREKQVIVRETCGRGQKRAGERNPKMGSLKKKFGIKKSLVQE